MSRVDSTPESVSYYRYRNLNRHVDIGLGIGFGTGVKRRHAAELRLFTRLGHVFILLFCDHDDDQPYNTHKKKWLDTKKIIYPFSACFHGIIATPPSAIASPHHQTAAPTKGKTAYRGQMTSIFSVTVRIFDSHNRRGQASNSQNESGTTLTCYKLRCTLLPRSSGL